MKKHGIPNTYILKPLNEQELKKLEDFAKRKNINKELILLSLKATPLYRKYPTLMI